MQILGILTAGLLLFSSQGAPKTISSPVLSQFTINQSCPRMLTHQDVVIRFFDYYPASNANANGITRIIKAELKQGKSKIIFWALFTHGWWWQTNYKLFQEKNGSLIPITIDELSKLIHFDIQAHHIAYIKNHRLC